MRKLWRSIEQNKKNVRARKVLMALLAATVAFSGAGSIVTYADVLPNSSDKLQVTIDNTNYTVDYGTPISSAGGPST